MNRLTRILLNIGAALLLPVGLFAEAPATATPHVVKDTEIRVLPRTRPDRQYQLHIWLPPSFAKEPTRKYPVVFVTDGYYDFTTVQATCANLVYDKLVPEMLVVGLGYAGENLDYERLRVTDLGPPVQYRFAGMEGSMAGQGDQFLEMIEHTAIPLLEHDYRADPEHRILMGASYGGQFALYALFARPQLFQGYVAATPVVTAVWPYEENFERSGRAIDARVFVTVGALEAPAQHRNITRFNERLAKVSYLKGGYQFRELDATRHASVKAESFTRGLQFACEAFAPERGVTPERFSIPGRSMYEIHFNAPAGAAGESAWSPAQQAAMRHQRQWFDDSLKENKIFFYVRTPDGAAENFATLGLFAADQQEAERAVAAAPAVAAGLLKFEAVQLTDKASLPAK